MLKILFFARVKEQLGCGAMELQWDEVPHDLDALQSYLCQRGGGAWPEVLGQDNIVRAVNQRVVNGNMALGDGDEVAFFPPMTGG